MLQQDIARLWPDWEVVRIIGRGNFGAVYEIRRDTFGHTETAALKVITIPQNESEIDELYSDGHTAESITLRFQSYLEDIVREYNLMVDMKGHPNVVYCDDLRFVQHEDGIGWNIYIKMELLTPLMKHFSVPVPEEEVIRLGRDICSALVLCRQMKIVHRDIKPQNIFVSRTGQYKLGDFGIAKTAERTTSGTKIGTYKYMAPEVYHNRPYGAGADIYSLGLVLYWLLNERRTPFQPTDHIPTASEEETARHRRLAGEAIPAPVHGSPELQQLVLKACAYDPKERFASAEEMLAALDALERGTPAPAPAPAPVPVAESTPAPVAAEEPTAEPEIEVDEPTVVPAPEVEEEDDTVTAAEVAAEEETMEEEELADAEEMEAEIAVPTPEEGTEQPPLPEKTVPKKRKKKVVFAIVATVVVLSIALRVLAPSRIQFGKLSAGDNTVMISRAVPKTVYGYDPYALTLHKDGSVTRINSDVVIARDAVSLSVSNSHFVILKSDGTIYTSGDNRHGQCNAGNWRDVVAITCGDTYTAGLTKDGKLLIAGKLSD